MSFSMPVKPVRVDDLPRMAVLMAETNIGLEPDEIKWPALTRHRLLAKANAAG